MVQLYKTWHPSILSLSTCRGSKLYKVVLIASMSSGSSWGILRRFQAKWDVFFLQHVPDLPRVLLQVELAWIIPTGRHPNQMPEPSQLAETSRNFTLSSFHPAKGS